MEKKEKFNLALWDRLKKENIPHSFETRNGKEVAQLVHFNTSETTPIYGVDKSDNSVESWDINGKYYGVDNKSYLDLFIVWDEEQIVLEGIADIYPNNNVVFHFNNPTPFHSTTIIARVKVSIPYTKGEGLNNG